MSVLAKFDEEIKTITERRGEVYGHPIDDFTIAAEMMQHFDHVEPVALRHALRMLCVKMARLAKTPDHLDSYIDIAGYARTAVMVMERYQGKYPPRRPYHLHPFGAPKQGQSDGG